MNCPTMDVLFLNTITTNGSTHHPFIPSFDCGVKCPSSQLRNKRKMRFLYTNLNYRFAGAKIQLFFTEQKNFLN